MPRMDGTGPENGGSKTGRGLGVCRKAIEEEENQKLGKGMGLRRNAGGGTGNGKRLRNDGYIITDHAETKSKRHLKR